MSRRRMRTALGRQLARLASGASPRAVLREALGADAGDRVAQLALTANFENAVRTREKGDEPRVTWRRSERRTEQLRHVATLVLHLAQRMSLETGRAASARLWLGRTWRWEGERRVYVRAESQGGLASLVGVCVRELERYLAVLQAGGVIKSWQPQESGARAPESLPRHLRGETYAYQHYQWIGELPKVLREHLKRWYQRHAKPESAHAAAVTPLPSGPAIARPEREQTPLSGGALAFIASLPIPS